MKLYHIMPAKYMTAFNDRCHYLIETPLLLGKYDPAAKQLRTYMAQWSGLDDEPLDTELAENEVIFDCGLAIGKAISHEEYFGLIEKYSPSRFVVPDVWKDSAATKRAAKSINMCSEIVRREAIWPLQGTNERELIKHAKWACSQLEEEDCLGIPYKHFPGKTAIERANGRLRFTKKLRDVIGYTDEIQLHYMGLWDWTELATAALLGVGSADSSYSFLLASKGQTLADVRDVKDGYFKAVERGCTRRNLEKVVHEVEQLMADFGNAAGDIQRAHELEIA